MNYLTEQGLDYLSKIDWMKILQKGITSVVVLVIILISVKIAYKAIDKMFNERKKGLNQRETRRIVTLNTTVKVAIKALIWGAGGLIIIGQFINVTSLLAVAGVGTLAISFGARSLVEDVMSGFVIVFENQFSVGDYIILDNSHHGIVETIGIRTTNLREFDGGLYIIHNGKIDRLLNYSKGNIKAIVEVGIAYEEDISRALEILNQLCEEIYQEKHELFKEQPEVLGVMELGDSAITIRLISDTDSNSKFAAERIMRKRIKDEFDRKGIEIPYNKTVVFTKNDEA